MPNPYAAPTSDVGAAPPSVVEGGTTSARAAGGLLVLNAVVSVLLALTRWRWRPAQGPEPIVFATLVLPQVLVALMDILLAVPLFRGSVRFRVLVWVRAWISAVFPWASLGFTYLVLSSRYPARAAEVLDGLGPRFFVPALFATALVLLVTKMPNRARFVAGLLCGGVYLILSAT